MTGITIALALVSAACFGLALVIAQLGLRYVPPIAGAAIALPSSTFLFLCAAPFILYEDESASWRAALLFASVGMLFPAAVTLLTFQANRLLGPVITGTLGNLAPLFAVAAAFILLGEPLRSIQLVGIVAIISGVVTLGLTRGGSAARWSSWLLLLPLTAAALRGLTQPIVKVGLELWPSPFAATLIGNAVSVVVVLTVARVRMNTFVLLPLTRGHAWFVGVGLCNGMAVMLMYAALATGPVVLVSPLVATYPLVTVVLSALILGKPKGALWLELSVALTVTGVALLIVG
jgi:drug/metabolite transporter (DMT)-like permease